MICLHWSVARWVQVEKTGAFQGIRLELTLKISQGNVNDLAKTLRRSIWCEHVFYRKYITYNKYSLGLAKQRLK